MRGELAILVLDIDDDAVTDPMTCRTPSGREASRPHTARLRHARGELLHKDVWEKA
jgi:hypothetical protein